MKEITIRLYDYDELSDEAKSRALEDWRNSDVEHFWGGEVKNTLDKLEKELGIEVTHWEYSSYSHASGVIRFKNYSDDQLALAGRRAQAFLWNHFGHLLLAPKTRYQYLWKGEWRDGVGSPSRKRKSNVFYTRVYDGTCPLTGVCFDCDALDPMANFCFGVEWSEKEHKRVMKPHDERWTWEMKTVEDVLRECVDSLLKAAQDDWDSQFTEEYFADFACANGFMFDEDGNRRNAP